MTTTSFRAAYWISADRQHEVVLTTEDEAGLADADLMAAATAEADATGLDIADGEIVIGEWAA